MVEALETKPQVEQPPLLYDLTTLQREANGRFGFSASRTLGAAQALYDQHKLLTYPRTNSRYLSGDMAGQLKSVVSGVGAAAPAYADPARYVLGLDRLPLGRVVNDARVTDHHAIIPTEGDHDLSGLSRDEQRVYDMVARRFLAVFHPAARFERTVVETRCAEHLFRSKGKVMIEAGWRAAYGESVADKAPPRTRPPTAAAGPRRTTTRPAVAPDARAPGQPVTCTTAEALAKRTKPPGRYSEGTLLRAMETAGKLVEDDEAAEAMKDAGIGTPATRAATIERLVDAEYIEREGRGLRATEKGIGLVTMLGDHVLTSPELTGRWEQRLNRIERGEEQASEFRSEIDGFTREVVAWFADKERGDLRIERTPLAPCPTPGCEGQIVEYPKSYGCNTYKGKEDPGLRLHAVEAAERPHHHPRRGPRARGGRALLQGPGEPARGDRPLPHPRLRRRDRGAHAQLRLHQLEEPLRDRGAATSSGRRCAARRARSTPRPPARWWPAARPTRPRRRSRSPSAPAPPPGAAARSSRTAAPTAAPAGRAARTRAAASSSGSARRATRSRARRPPHGSRRPGRRRPASPR